ncbi:MAG TPA: hypothetical protein V6C72_18020, partial [Chroococcales cyanobacterium]
MFSNRRAAGIQLAEMVDRYLYSTTGANAGVDAIVVGLPRGGVPVALEIARKLHCPLDVLVAKKLPFPGQPEYAIGAVSSDGVVVLNPDIPHVQNWNTYIDQQRSLLLDSTKSTERQFYRLAGCTPS